MPGRWGLPPIVDVVIFAPVQWVSVRRALFCPQPECAPRVCAHRWVQRLPPRRSGWESSPSAPPNPRCGAARPRQWRPVAQSPRRSEGSSETPVARQSPDGCPPLDLQRSPAPARVPVCARALRRLLFCLHPPSRVWPSGCLSSRPAHLRRLLLRPPPSRASLFGSFSFPSVPLRRRPRLPLLFLLPRLPRFFRPLHPPRACVFWRLLPFPPARVWDKSLPNVQISLCRRCPMTSFLLLPKG